MAAAPEKVGSQAVADDDGPQVMGAIYIPEGRYRYAPKLFLIKNALHVIVEPCCDLVNWKV
jgi:hypothetical protein